MMQNRTLKWHERFQFEIGGQWQLVKSRDMTWREWLFSPSFGMTRIGQEITTRYQLPESTQYGVDTLSVGEGTDRKYYSNVFWIHGAIRILGLDIGLSIFWRRSES